MPLSVRRVGVYTVTVPAVGLAAWAGLLMTRAGAAEFALTPLALAVALSAWHGGLGPGLFSLIQSALAIGFFFSESGTSFRFNAAEMAAFSAFVAGWAAFCFLAGRLFQETHLDRQLRTAAEDASSQAHRLAQLTAALAQARTPRAAVE